MMKNRVILILSFVFGCSNNSDYNPSIELKSPNDDFVSRIYIDMWGGSAGGVEYIVNVQKKLEQANSDKNIVFKTSKEGKICIDWLDEKNLKISTNLNSHISVKKKILYLDDKKIYIKYSDIANLKNCINLQNNQTKFDINKN